MITLELNRWQADRIEQALSAKVRMCGSYINMTREIEIRKAEYEAVLELVQLAIMNE